MKLLRQKLIARKKPMAVLLVTAFLSSSMGSVSLAQFANTDFYAEHGIGPETQNGGGVNMATVASWAKSYSPSSNAYNLNYNTTANGIESQAALLRNNINSNSWNKNVILIGHSMGGLRSRYYSQYLARYDNKVPQIKGLLTLDSPNNGAPLINNAPIVLTRIETDVNVAMLGFAKPILNTFTGMEGFKDLPATAFFFNGAQGAQDLKPQSPFLNKLNNLSMVNENCRWVSSGWWIFTQWYQICDRVPDRGNAPIPDSIVTGSIKGTANNIFDSYPLGRAGAIGVSIISAAAVAGYMALAPATFGFSLIPAGYASDLFNIASNAQAFWKSNVVGSWEGDGIVPYDSQSIYSANSNIGGKGKHEYKLPVSHSGAIGVTSDSRAKEAIEMFLRQIPSQ